MKNLIGRPKVLATLAAVFWLAVGTRMLVLGIQSALNLQNAFQIAAVFLISSIVIYFKGFILFGKMARENMARLRDHDTPIPLYKIFPTKTYLFILVFAPTGITLGKFLEDPFYRAMILFSVGSALFAGGLFYFYYWKSVFSQETAAEAGADL